MKPLDRNEINKAMNGLERWTGDDRHRDRATAIRQAKGAWGFPPLHAERMGLRGGCELDDQRKKAWAALIEAVQRRGTVLMHGDRGGGKTQLATMLGVLWWKNGYTRHGAARYWTANGLLDEQRAWFRKADGDGPLWTAKDCGLLVLDEINEIRSDTQFGVSEIVGVIDYRYGRAYPTVMLTNLKPQAVADVIGWSVLDRIKDRGAVIECNWNNYRDVIRKGGA